MDMTATPSTMVVAGKTLTLRALTISDLGEFVQWVRSEVIRSAVMAAKTFDPETDKDLRREIVDSAVAQGAKIKLGDPMVESYADSIEGVLRLLWMATDKVDGNAPPLLEGFAAVVSSDLEGVQGAVSAIVKSTPFLSGGGDRGEATAKLAG